LTNLKGRKFKTGLIANVSHDLRTPIANAILETLQIKKKPSPMKNENAIDMVSQAQKN
jgi:K+-sensing histidine kinase KdpD